MLGFLKKLVSKPAAEQPKAPVPSPAPAQVPTPKTEPAAAPTVEIPEPGSDSGETLEISYKTLASRLPEPVQRCVTSRSGILRLPVSMVLPQIARGEVKVTLAQLAQLSTEGSITVPAGQGNSTVSLPLSEILPLLKAEHMGRRANQRKLAISEEIPDVFDQGGAVEQRIVSMPETLPAGTQPPPTEPPPAPITAPLPIPSPTVTAIPAPAAKPLPAAEVAPQSGFGQVAGPETPPPLIAPSGLPPAIKPPAVETPPIKSSISLPPPTSKPTSSIPVAAAVTEKEPEALPVHEGPQESLTVAMLLMTSHFAALGKTELANLSKAVVFFPERDLEAALKRGKAAFPWREVKKWLRNVDSMPALDDSEQIVFPLSVLAPIFLQSRSTVKAQKKLELTEHIPDLFTRPGAPTGYVQEEAAPEAPIQEPPPAIPGLQMAQPPAPLPAATTPAPTPSVAPVVMPEPTFVPPPLAPAPTAPATPAPPAPKPMMDFGDIFGLPNKKDWTLQEVAQKCASLRGVAGAVITTGDGLLVAGVWPGGVTTESAAAFVPQMFSRISQYSKELNLGNPGQFTLLIENVPLQIFRTGPNYFTVLGKAGEPLPKVQLSALALRLSQTKPSK